MVHTLCSGITRFWAKWQGRCFHFLIESMPLHCRVCNTFIKPRSDHCLARVPMIDFLFTWSFSLVILCRWTVRNSSGTLIFFILSPFFGRNRSEISLAGWHLVIFRAEQLKKHPVQERGLIWLYLANNFLAPPPRGVVALVSVSDDKMQMTILILRRGALSNFPDIPEAF